MISMGEPIYGFVTKGDGKALKAQIVGVDVAENRMVILYEDGTKCTSQMTCRSTRSASLQSARQLNDLGRNAARGAKMKRIWCMVDIQEGVTK